MAAATNITQIKRQMLAGKGVFRPFMHVNAGASTAANSGCGFFTAGLSCNAIGTTYPSTLVGFQMPPATASLRSSFFENMTNAQRAGWWGYFYRFGTVDLTTSGVGRFTHDSTFTRLRRTVMGTANTNINVLPLIYVTAASATSNYLFSLEYVDQDGNTTSGSLNNTFPSVTTAAQSLYFIFMNDGDCAVQNVTDTGVGQTCTAGTASIYGFEPLFFWAPHASGEMNYVDTIFGGLKMGDIRPATPDAGTVTSFLGVLHMSNAVSVANAGFISGFENV